MRNRQLGGFKFVRQKPIGNYFVDFVCRERKLVIEVDGATHGSPDEFAYDRSREEYLVRTGYRVMRITNEDARTNMDRVLDAIHSELEGLAILMTGERPPLTPALSPRAGRGSKDKA